MFTRRFLVAEPNHQNLQSNLEKEPAQYNYMENTARTFIFPICQNQCIQENVFSNGPIRRIAVAMNTNSAVAGFFHEKSFHYQETHLREHSIIRGVEEQLFHQIQQGRQCSLTKSFQLFQ